MDWKDHARRLAAATVHPSSRWRGPLAATPRHLFVPRWWENQDGRWALRDGPADGEAWLRAAYADRTLVTRVGPLHADHATGPADTGLPTSSSTLPSLVVAMYRHALIGDGCDVLVTCGSGYGTALLCHRLGPEHVTSVDIDPYLVQAAGERLASAGQHPKLAVCDLTGPLPGTVDRIVSTVAVPSIPTSWLEALRPGGRLVTTLADTGLIVTADKTEDGGAVGRVEWDRAAFMTTRHGEDYPPVDEDLFQAAQEVGERVTRSPYPVVNVREGWELWSVFSLHHPGVAHRYAEDEGGQRTAWMVHPDGSWARATGHRAGGAEVHQGGPRRLWDELDRIRRWWLADGYLSVYGAKVTVSPQGITALSRGGWSVIVS